MKRLGVCVDGWKCDGWNISAEVYFPLFLLFYCLAFFRMTCDSIWVVKDKLKMCVHFSHWSIYICGEWKGMWTYLLWKELYFFHEGKGMVNCLLTDPFPKFLVISTQRLFSIEESMLTVDVYGNGGQLLTYL